MNTVSISISDEDGTGFLMGSKPNGDGSIVHQIAVITGSFDDHRNEKGELWVNEFEKQ